MADPVRLQLLMGPGIPFPAPREVLAALQEVKVESGSGESQSGFVFRFRPLDEGFAGIIHARPPEGGADLSLYCIDILTGYVRRNRVHPGTWDTANVPNVGYVTRLLNEYYPNTAAPGLANLNETAAAVQAAIWYFTDRYVLNASDRCTAQWRRSSPTSKARGRWSSSRSRRSPSPRRT